MINPQRRIDNALGYIEQYGGIEGEHHRAWVIDQVVRCLVPDYPQWVRDMNTGDDGPATYDWDVGIPP